MCYILFYTTILPMFCKLHNFLIEPTTNTLSFYTIYMYYHIQLCLVASYLSGICSKLEPYFHYIWTVHAFALISQTLVDACKHLSVPTIQKKPLSLKTLLMLINSHSLSCHNVIVFITLTLYGFFSLYYLRELIHPNNAGL